MSRTLRVEDIAIVGATLRQEIETKTTQGQGAGTGRALGLEILPELVNQLLVPVVASLVSRALYDVAKDRLIGALRKEEVTNLTGQLVGQPVSPTSTLSPDAYDALRSQLLPLGYSDDDIRQLYEKVKARVTTGDDR
jgi:hypothetical protein